MAGYHAVGVMYAYILSFKTWHACTCISATSLIEGKDMPTKSLLHAGLLTYLYVLGKLDEQIVRCLEMHGQYIRCLAKELYADQG